jgi:hypothetical protein
VAQVLIVLPMADKGGALELMMLMALSLSTGKREIQSESRLEAIS